MSELLDKWHCYETTPIDHWDGWEDVSTLVTHLVEQKAAGAQSMPLQKVLALFSEAAYAVSQKLVFDSKISRKGYPTAIWEGDMREAAFYVAYPDGQPPSNLHEVVLGWKQDNNGTCFIASQIPLEFDDFRNYCDAPVIAREGSGFRIVPFSGLPASLYE